MVEKRKEKTGSTGGIRNLKKDEERDAHSTGPKAFSKKIQKKCCEGKDPHRKEGN